MKCPHCLVEIHKDEEITHLKEDTNGSWMLTQQICPSCKKNIIFLMQGEWYQGHFHPEKRFLAYPKSGKRPPASAEVPVHIAEDFNEACLIISESPKASAALSRRCLQTILREQKGIKKGSLDSEIEQALSLFPSYIADAIDAVRQVGNFAAHPIKSNSTGEIASVEPGEAEWLLDVLEQLFDFCYIQPKILADKRAKLNKKLQDLGKPDLKSKKI